MPDQRHYSEAQLHKYSVGDPIRATDLNAYRENVLKNYQAARGYAGRESIDTTHPEFEFGELEAFNTLGEKIPSYCIFSMDAPGRDLSKKGPIIEIKKYAAGDLILFTNQSVELPDQTSPVIEMIGRRRPYLLKYKTTDGHPETGDELGPIVGEFEISKKGTGFVALTKALQSEGLVWVALLSSEGSNLGLAESTLDADLCAISSVSLTDDEAILWPSRATKDMTGITISNRWKHQGPTGSLVTLAKSHTAPEQWEIIDIQLRDVCTIVGIEDTAACLNYWPLKLGGEWCAANEPAAKIKLIQYKDCDAVDITPCDLALTFDPTELCP